MTVFEILLGLAEGDRSAAEILDAIQARAGAGAGSGPSVASFYRNLKSAMADGWVETAEAGTETKSPGRPGQSYRLTARGRTAVRTEASRLRSLANLALGDE